MRTRKRLRAENAKCLPVPTLSALTLPSSSQALCAAGSGPRCWCQNRTKSGRVVRPRRGVPAWSSPRACCSPPAAKDSKSWPGRGGRGLSWGTEGSPCHPAGEPCSRLGSGPILQEQERWTHVWSSPGHQALSKEADPKPQAQLPASLSPWPRVLPWARVKAILGGCSCMVFRILTGILRGGCETGTHRHASKLHKPACGAVVSQHVGRDPFRGQLFFFPQGSSTLHLSTQIFTLRVVTMAKSQL